jgi:hypothetical protein
MAKGNKTIIEFTSNGHKYQIEYPSHSEALKSIRAWLKANNDKSKHQYNVVG